MKIEIATEGPWEAIRALHRKLPGRSENPEPGTGGDPRRARLTLIEEENTLHSRLITISRIVDGDLRVADRLEFRVPLWT